MKNNFFHNKNIFITGNTGFKGSWMSLWLKMLGANITGFSLKPQSGGIYDLIDLDKSVKSIIGDIRDQDLISKSIKASNPDILIHLAAQPLVRRSYTDPIETFSTNLMGTVNILEASRKCQNLKSILVVTSDKCYKNVNKDYGYIETDELGGHDPYSNSKAGQELIVDSFKNSFFSKKHSDIHIATVRAGNVIGGGDVSEDRLIPDAFRAFKNKNKLLIRNENATRPWQHVLEPISGYIELSEKLYDNNNYDGAWNLGPFEKDTKSVGFIADTICRMWGCDAEWVKESLTDHPHEAYKLSLNIEKSLKLLKWSPKLNIDEALSLTIGWEKSRIADHNMFDVTCEQISNYKRI